MRTHGVLILMASALISGCANLFTSTKDIDFSKHSYALDVKQRVVFATDLDVYGDGRTTRIICAEPSPDALATISATAGANVATELAKNASKRTEVETSEDASRASASQSVSAALAEQGAFVGLRTQSIQLLRDTMYRLCEGYAAGAIQPSEFAAMQRRYQSTMMGLLAIEQLTRPVVAAQVALASNASTQAGPGPADAELERARDRLDELVKADTQAKVDLSNAELIHKEKTKLVEDNAKQTSEARAAATKSTEGDAAAKKAAGDAAAKPFEDARPELLNTQAEARQTLNAAQIKATAAANSRRDAENEVASAKSKVSSFAAGGGRFGEIREASASMTSTLATNVHSIVKEINKSYLRDGCFSLLQSLAAPVPVKFTSRPNTSQESTAVAVAAEACGKILQDTTVAQ